MSGELRLLAIAEATSHFMLKLDEEGLRSSTMYYELEVAYRLATFSPAKIGANAELLLEHAPLARVRLGL